MKHFKYYYTYKVTCTEGSFKDKIYYGQHKTNDLNDGYKGSGTKLLNYYKKYPTSYTIEIIQFYSNQDELNEAEYELIKPHLNNDYCLNLCDGGMQGTCSEETRKKISEAHKGRKLTEEHKKILLESNKGRKQSEETRKKIAEAIKGRKQSEETRRKKSEAMKGRHTGINSPMAKQCTINRKTYDCIKDAWRDICPEIPYSTFIYRYIKNK